MKLLKVASFSLVMALGALLGGTTAHAVVSQQYLDSVAVVESYLTYITSIRDSVTVEALDTAVTNGVLTTAQADELRSLVVAANAQAVSLIPQFELYLENMRLQGIAVYTRISNIVDIQFNGGLVALGEQNVQLYLNSAGRHIGENYGFGGSPDSAFLILNSRVIELFPNDPTFSAFGNIFPGVAPRPI